MKGLHFYWAACGTQFSFEKRENGWWLTQRALRVPPPLQWDRFLRGGDRSFRVVWWIDLEVDLEPTRSYCPKLLNLNLGRMIITSAEREVKDSWRSGMPQSCFLGDKIGHAKSVGFRLEITSISFIYSLTFAKRKELLFWLARGLFQSCLRMSRSCFGINSSLIYSYSYLLFWLEILTAKVFYRKYWGNLG